MTKAKPGIVVVGSGKAFGKELCGEILSQDHRPQIVSRNPPPFVHKNRMDWQRIDLLGPQIHLDLAAQQFSANRPIAGVIFNAVSSRAKSLDKVRVYDIEADLRVAARMLSVYKAFRTVLLDSGGTFVATGGDFAEQPHPDHVGLSLGKVVTSRLAELIDQGDGKVPIYEHVIAGAAEPQATQIASDLVELVLHPPDFKT
jgi:hypothetical protein